MNDQVNTGHVVSKKNTSSHIVSKKQIKQGNPADIFAGNQELKVQNMHKTRTTVNESQVETPHRAENHIKI